MVKSQNHTPTPWANGKKYIEDIHAPDGRLIARVNCGAIKSQSDRDKADADAAHIVRCVNAHDDLVAALQRSQMAMLGYTHRNEVIQAALDAIDSALKKAKE